MSARWPMPKGGWTVAVVGCGIAGRARVRALEQVAGARLVAVHRGRFADQAGVPVVDEDAVLASADVVIVASPSETHEDWVERALRAGRHVIVEYPLARTAQGARRLFALAAQVDRLLHVEHIELLAPTTRWMAEEAALHGWTTGAMRFTSGGEAHASGAEHAWLQLSRVHRIVAALGWPQWVDVARVDGASVDAVLGYAGDRTCALQARRGPDEPRSLTWEIQTGSGTLAIEDRTARRDGQPVTLPATTLFVDDTRIALARLDGEGSAYATDDRLIRAMELVSILGCPGRSEF